MKTFLSIGSGPGIGISTVERFAREGYRVVLTSRRQDYLDERVQALQAAGYTAVGFRLDAGDIAAVVALVQQVEAEFGAIDVLHFNAAAMHAASFTEQSIEGFIQDLNINVGAAFAAIKQAAPGMFARQAGTLLLTCGGFALTPHVDYLTMGVGKAGLRNLALGLFEPFKAQGVHIAMLTVAANVSAGSPQVKTIADRFWALHAQPQESWAAEAVYSDA